ncbi:MAG TPA: type II toxin-antitoxin system prevent-host-death family antitoxin [Vicinamibacterales bacterium]|nr:type II toxin-antitoxin system prevent-host-death family antitoxin [Vicinamibacterales bacterium]
MTRIKIGEFRDRASELIRRAAGGETIIILNRDREVARVVPARAVRDAGAGLVGSLAGTAKVCGNIEEPIGHPGGWFEGGR